MTLPGLGEIEGIRGLYPHIPAPIRIKAFIAICRPFTLLPALLVPILGALIASAYTGLPVPWAVVPLVALALALGQAAGQSWNAGCDDPRMDEANGKTYRPVVKGLITPQEAVGFGNLLALGSIATALAVGGPFPFYVLALVGMACFYNMRPVRIRNRLWGALIWLGVSRGLLPLPAAWSIVSPGNDALPWLLGAVLGVWTFAWNSSKDIGDMEGDRAFGIRTFPNTYGLEATGNLLLGSAAATMLLAGLLALTRVVPLLTAPLVALVCLPACWVALGVIRGRVKENRVLEGGRPWTAFYGTLVGLYVAFLAGAWVG